jgi:hypothetical protein
MQPTEVLGAQCRSTRKDAASLYDVLSFGRERDGGGDKEKRKLRNEATCDMVFGSKGVIDEPTL